jgi:hypothetical protein
MAYKSIGQHSETHRFTSRALSTEDLRRVFETAMHEIAQSNLATHEGLKYGIPIVQRARRFRISKASAEESALSDAARALAKLWKV